MSAHAGEVSTPLHRARRALSRHVYGEGVELGPGSIPFPVRPRWARVRYVDRWHPWEARHLFPEIRKDAEFLDPDLVTDFDTERLQCLADDSQDFVIASHVLEHLAEPLGFLVDIYRVLRPGGLLLLVLPDRRRTFDSKREPTPLRHLIEEYERGVDRVSDEHIVEFLDSLRIPYRRHSPERLRADLELHRARSIHVHCWSETEFVDVLAHCIGAMGQAWRLIDALTPNDEGKFGFEFGFVLLKDPANDAVADADLASVFVDSWREWFESRCEAFDHLHALRRKAALRHRVTMYLSEVTDSAKWLVVRVVEDRRRRLRRYNSDHISLPQVGESGTTK